MTKNKETHWSPADEKEIGYEHPHQPDMKPFRSTSDAVIKVSLLVVGYMFITAIIGSFVHFGGIWWAIVFSYIAAIAGGIAYIGFKYDEYENFIKIIKDRS